MTTLNAILQLTFMCSTLWQVLHALLWLLTFEFTRVIDNFCIHNCNWQLLYALSETTTFVFTATFDNHNYQLFQALHYIITMADSYWYYCNQLLVYALLQLLTSVCITSNDNLCMHYCTWLFYALLQLHALLQLRNPTSRRSETLIITTWITL